MSYCRVDSRGRVTRSSSTLSGLGKFSLKRAFRIPKGVRKFQPGIYIKKHPLALAPLLLIPGAAPLVARGVMGAGKLAVRGGRGLFRGAAGLLKRAKLPTNALKEAANLSTPLPALRPIPAETAPTDYGPMTPMAAPMSMAAGGGGGGAPANYGDTPGAAAPVSSDAAPSQAGLGVGALVVGGLVLFGIMASRKRH